MRVEDALVSQFGPPPNNGGLAPLNSWQAIAAVFASEPGATNPRTGRPTRGYVTQRISETSGPQRPLLFGGGRNTQYGIGRRTAQRYVTQEGKQTRGRTLGPGDPVFERVRAAAEESRRRQQGQAAQQALGNEGFRDIADTGIDVTITGTFYYSNREGKRYRTLSASIDGDDLDDFLTLWAAGDEKGAAEAFQVAFFDALSFPSSGEFWLDIEEIMIR